MKQKYAKIIIFNLVYNTTFIFLNFNIFFTIKIRMIFIKHKKFNLILIFKFKLKK